MSFFVVLKQVSLAALHDDVHDLKIWVIGGFNHPNEVRMVKLFHNVDLLLHFLLKEGIAVVDFLYGHNAVVWAQSLEDSAKTTLSYPFQNLVL